MDCKKGTSVHAPEIYGALYISERSQNDFGEYDSIVKEILRGGQWFEPTGNSLGRKPYWRTRTVDGHCIFYDKKKEQCMLGNQRLQDCSDLHGDEFEKRQIKGNSRT